MKKESITDALTIKPMYEGEKNCKPCNGTGSTPSNEYHNGANCCYFCQGSGYIDPKSSYAMKNKNIKLI